MSLQLEDLTGWDQDRLSHEEFLKIRMETSLWETDHPHDPDHKDCDSCGGWGFIHTEIGERELEIERCDNCGRFTHDEDAIEYHRTVCKCRWPEHAPRDTEYDILLKKRLVLQDLKCPACGNDSTEHEIYLKSTASLRLKGRTLASDPIAGLGLRSIDRAHCSKCNHTGLLHTFAPSSKEWTR